MWACPKCGESSEDQFDSCWKCSTPKGASPVLAEMAMGVQPALPRLRLTYQMYRGTLATWEELFSKAAQFASDIGPERVLNISHSVDDCDGVVTVWYWTPDNEPPKG